MTVSGRPSNLWRSPGTFFTPPLDVSQKFYADIEAVIYVSIYIFTYISICLPIVNIKKEQ